MILVWLWRFKIVPFYLQKMVIHTLKNVEDDLAFFFSEVRTLTRCHKIKPKFHKNAGGGPQILHSHVWTLCLVLLAKPLKLYISTS